MGKLIAIAVGLIGGYIFYQAQLPPGYPPGTVQAEAVANQTVGVAVFALVVGGLLIKFTDFDLAKTLGVALIAAAFPVLGLSLDFLGFFGKTNPPASAPATAAYRPLPPIPQAPPPIYVLPPVQPPQPPPHLPPPGQFR
jgi:hypothetical protein